MGLWDKMLERNNATIQAAVPEPCVAIGALQPAGTSGAFGLSYVSGAASMFKQHKANKNAGALTARHGLKTNHITYIALTADKLYALDAKPRRRNIKVVGTLAEWDRRDLTAQVIPGKVATRVVLDHADGGHYELESMNMGHGNDPLFAELRTLTRS
jgi:hypothetical protein